MPSNLTKSQRIFIRISAVASKMGPKKFFGFLEDLELADL
jgi:hypothetical protein